MLERTRVIATESAPARITRGSRWCTAPLPNVRARVPTAALFGVREIVVRRRTPVKVKGAYATAAQGSRKTCGRQVGRVTSRSWRPGLGGHAPEQRGAKGSRGSRRDATN